MMDFEKAIKEAVERNRLTALETKMRAEKRLSQLNEKIKLPESFESRSEQGKIEYIADLLYERFIRMRIRRIEKDQAHNENGDYDFVGEQVIQQQIIDATKLSYPEDIVEEAVKIALEEFSQADKS